MALGKRQKELISKWWRSPVSGYRLNVYCSKRYLNSRETGRGFPVMLEVIHHETNDVETRLEIARCQSEYTGEQKVGEVNAYITQLTDEWLERFCDE